LVYLAVGLAKFHGLKSIEDARQRVQDAVKILTSSGLLLDGRKESNDELESYTGISLTRNKISKLPNYELHLPHLDTFLIYGKNVLPMFFDEFIKGMKEGNKSLHDISILGEMKELEILIVRKTGITEIPQEIGQLVNLRRLDAWKCKNPSHVAPGVISKLWRLEELCIGFNSVREGICDRIVE
ncbi:NB-ARC domains-containing protein, partial [Tanacetum coccineum]